MLLHEDLGEAVDRSQWCSKIVRDGVAERFELAVGGLEVARAFDDASFQVSQQARAVDGQRSAISQIHQRDVSRRTRSTSSPVSTAGATDRPTSVAVRVM